MESLIIVLTVAESKRLIAKGLVKLLEPDLGNRIIALAKGTTNSYIYEELQKEKIEKKTYMIGHITPEKIGSMDRTLMSDLVLKNGKKADLTVIDAVNEMNEGDIFIKGANCLNYKEKTAGVIAGSIEGGTIGAVLSKIKEKNIRLIIPVGLEKTCSESAEVIAKKLSDNNAIYRNNPLRMWSITGEIITEIEALNILTNVKATHMASGGIDGAEGGVVFFIEGIMEEINKTKELIDNIQGEKSF